MPYVYIMSYPISISECVLHSMYCTRTRRTRRERNCRVNWVSSLRLCCHSFVIKMDKLCKHDEISGPHKLLYLHMKNQLYQRVREDLRVFLITHYYFLVLQVEWRSGIGRKENDGDSRPTSLVVPIWHYDETIIEHFFYLLVISVFFIFMYYSKTNSLNTIVVNRFFNTYLFCPCLYKYNFLIIMIQYLFSVLYNFLIFQYLSS